MRQIKNNILLVTRTKVKMFVYLILLIPFSISSSFAQQEMESYSKNEKSSLLAAGLSLQPLPIDLGNLYAGYLDRAMLYMVRSSIYHNRNVNSCPEKKA